MVCVPALGPTLACGSHTTGLRSRLLCAHTSRRRSASSAWRRTAATSFATLTAHGRPVSHLHHRDALLDPLHGLVLLKFSEEDLSSDFTLSVFSTMETLVERTLRVWVECLEFVIALFYSKPTPGGIFSNLTKASSHPPWWML